MNVKVRFFAAAREVVGTDEMAQELSNDATVQDLETHLYEAYPALEPLRLRVAVNASYVAPDTPLQAGDEVACIPPVGGG